MPDRLDQLMKLHEADPADADLPYMIAMEHAGSGDPAEAVRWFDRALAIQPDYHYAYFHQARAWSDLGDDAAALRVLETGLARAVEAGNEKAAGEMRELQAFLRD